jgi:hypothetical protein
METRAGKPQRNRPLIHGQQMSASDYPLSTEAVRALGSRLLTEELILLPVRHHSPACALQLKRLIVQKKPSVVLIEGPRSFTPLLPLLAHVDACAPLAIYTYTVQHNKSDEGEETRRAAYYPFCDYSPELVALREAQRLNIPSRFIDLDFSEQSWFEAAGDDEEAISLLDEKHYRRSRYLQELARRSGCRDHEELWEHLFEVSSPEQTLEAHIEQVSAYCQLSRCDSTDEELSLDGTLQREAEMAWHIQQVVAQREPGSGPVLAVMGGFHAVVMPDLLALPVKRPVIPHTGIKDEASALIRYSFDRLDRLNGYAAGMTSPAWHQRLWERMLQQEKAGQSGIARMREEVTLSMLFDIADELRKRHELPLPVPALAAAYEQALRLASLRGRAAPVRDDVMDAVTSCFIKGDADADGAIVRRVAQHALSGHALGRVPSGAGKPPLVKDFEFRARRQRLKVDAAEPRRLLLDIYRRPEHRMTSRLLHGLALLDIPFAVRTAGPDFVSGSGLDRLQEQWEYLYSPMTEGALVEASVYGVTVALAVANRFVVQLNQAQAQGQGRDARAASAALVKACVLGLHDHLPRVIGMLRSAINEDAALDSVAAAAMSIALLWESREPLEARDVVELPQVLQSAYEKAIFLGTDLRGASAEGELVAQALMQLRELLRSEAGRTLDENLYWNMLRGMQLEHELSYIRGASAGLLYAAGHLTEHELAAALLGHLDGMLQPHDSVGYFRGLLQTAREAAWQQPALMQVLDTLLTQWDEAVFVTALPELRLAFAEMTPKETDRIAEAVAQLHGVENLGRLVRHDLSESQLQANLLLSNAVNSVLAADGLAAWGAA